MAADICRAGACPGNARRVSFLGEFGGLGCRIAGHLWTEKAWGYGATGGAAAAANGTKAVEARYVVLMGRIAELAAQGLGGAVYTQTTDVEAEVNGLMTYDRKVLKFDPAILRTAHERIYDSLKR